MYSEVKLGNYLRIQSALRRYLLFLLELPKGIVIVKFSLLKLDLTRSIVISEHGQNYNFLYNFIFGIIKLSLNLVGL